MKIIFNYIKNLINIFFYKFNSYLNILFIYVFVRLQQHFLVNLLDSTQILHISLVTLRVDSRTISHTQSPLYPRSNSKVIACRFKYLNLYH
jgi:hypothetical protein